MGFMHELLMRWYAHRYSAVGHELVNKKEKPITENLDPGWFYLSNDKELVGVICPECGELQELSGHHIDWRGYVHPSIVCANDDCKWHIFGILEGWEEERWPDDLVYS